MSNKPKTRGELNHVAVKVHHYRPLIALALGAAVVGAYLWVGDSLYLVAGAVTAYYVHLSALKKHSMRHTVMASCRRCANLGLRGRLGSTVNRMLVWYFHRRIVDGKAAMLLVLAGIAIAVVYTSLGKPNAVLPFLVVYELFLVQFAVTFRSLVVHRGNEVSCRLCTVAGDEMHPYGRVQPSELKD